MPVAQKHRQPKQVFKPPITTSQLQKPQTIIQTPQTQIQETTQREQRTATLLANDQAQVRLQQSTAVIHELLDASFGCIAFLRGLLPDQNFVDYYFTQQPKSTLPSHMQHHRNNRDSDSAPPSSQGSVGMGGSQSLSGKGGKGLKIKKIRRGYSTEADKVLDWIDRGVMDAVEKQYLKSCIFSIYIDEDHPEDIIEAFTISFYYSPIAGTELLMPQVEISDLTNGLSINEKSTVGDLTVGEVKRSLRKLIKSLIMACQTMCDFPTRRFVSMRLMYMDHTPDDYEPPCFKPLDLEKNPLFLGTEDRHVGPEKITMGVLETPYHAVSVKVTSVAFQLPTTQQEEEQDAQAYGGSSIKVLGKRSRDEEALQRESAIKRKYLWKATDDVEKRADIDPGYRDAPGETDYDSSQAQPMDEESQDVPIGVRNDDGDIEPLIINEENPVVDRAMEEGGELEPRNEGLPVRMSQVLDEVAATNIHEVHDPQVPIVQTQPDASSVMLEPTQINGNTQDIEMEVEQPFQNMNVQNLIEPEQDSVLQAKTQDDPMEDIDGFESVPADKAMDLDRAESIQSFGGTPVTKDNKPPDAPRTSCQQSKLVQAALELSLSEITEKNMTENQRLKLALSKKRSRVCPCGDKAEDNTMVQCEICKIWNHLPCTGYYTTKALPDTYYCLLCVLAKGDEYTVDQYQKATENFPGLSLSRRALKYLYSEYDILNETLLRKQLSADPADLRKLIERFKSDGFLIEQPQPPLKNGKKKAGRPPALKLKVNKSAAQKKKLEDYFKPGGRLEYKYFGRNPDVSDPVQSRKKAIDSARGSGTAEVTTTKQQEEKTIDSHDVPQPMEEPVEPINDVDTIEQEATESNVLAPVIDRPTIPIPKNYIPLPGGSKQKKSTTSAATKQSTFRTAAPIGLDLSKPEQMVQKSVKASIVADSVDMGIHA